MPIKKENPWSVFDTAFTMGVDDRFHKIMVSAPVLFANAPDVETILTFFLIRRANKTFSIVSIVKTYEKGNEKVISRNALTKDNIPEERIELESKGIQSMFTQSIEEGSGVKLQWNVLDLSGDTEMTEQVKKIQEFGHVAAFVDDGKVSPN